MWWENHGDDILTCISHIKLRLGVDKPVTHDSCLNVHSDNLGEWVTKGEVLAFLIIKSLRDSGEKFWVTAPDKGTL